MTAEIVELASGMPHWLGTVLISMLPVAELRLSIPVAITQFDINPIEAFFLSWFGNIIPVPFIIFFIRPVFAWLKKFKVAKMLVEKIEKRGHAKAETVLKYKFWGLFILVAIPLPGTGAWTGAIVSALMDLRMKSAFPAITLGVAVAGVIVTLMTTGVLKIFGL